MKKKELLYYDLDAPDWLIKRKDLRETALVREKDEESGLMLYKFYRRDDISKGIHEPFLVIFKDRHMWLNYYPKGKRWGKASIQYSYAPELYSYWHILANLRTWQNKILSRRFRLEQIKTDEKTSNVMAAVPELPEDFREFCEEEVMKDANYLVYNSVRKSVYCTHCKKKYSIEELIQRNGRKPKHGYYAMCDKCCVELQTISEGMSRRNRVFRYSTEIMQQYREGIIVREFNVFRNFEKTLTPETGIYEIKRHIFSNDKYLRYESRWNGKGTRKWHRIKPGRYFTELTYANGILYWRNIKETLENTKYNEYNLHRYLNRENVSIKKGFEAVFERIIEQPYIEQFIKAGLYGLSDSVINGSFYERLIDRKQTELVKMLKINREQLRWLRASRNQYEVLVLLQQANEAGKYISEYEVTVYDSSSKTHKAKELILSAGVNTKKMCRYIEGMNITLEDFADHMELMVRLGIPLKKQYLYPKDFVQVHSEEIEADILKNDKISEEIQQKFKKTYSKWKQIAGGVAMQDAEYTVVFPTDCADIKTEGRILHHCVGNYAERAAAGETVILFMRKKDNVQRRLYTMEYQNGALVQIRGACNSAPETRAREFAEQFAKEFKEAEKRYIVLEKKKAGKAAV